MPWFSIWLLKPFCLTNCPSLASYQLYDKYINKPINAQV